MFSSFSTVQHECIPQAILGMDIICQAKSGMGKTAVFVLATLQQLEQIDGQVSVLVMCHTRELAFQISKEYERFSKYMNNIKVSVFFGGISIKKDQQTLKTNCPHIVVGTPGRILALAREKSLNLKHIKHFILDECDKMLEQLGKCWILSLNNNLSSSRFSSLTFSTDKTSLEEDVSFTFRNITFYLPWPNTVQFQNVAISLFKLLLMLDVIIPLNRNFHLDLVTNS